MNHLYRLAGQVPIMKELDVPNPLQRMWLICEQFKGGQGEFEGEGQNVRKLESMKMRNKRVVTVIEGEVGTLGRHRHPSTGVHPFGWSNRLTDD